MMAYTPYYAGGWQSDEEGDTPVTPAALNHMDEGIAGCLENDGPSDLRAAKLAVSQVNDLFSLRGTVDNASNAEHNGDDVSFNVQNGGLMAYDHTGGAPIWTLPGVPRGGAESGTITAGPKCTVQYSTALKIGALGFVAIRAVVDSGETLSNTDVIATCSIKPTAVTGALAVAITQSGASVSNIYPSLGRLNADGTIVQTVASSAPAGSVIYMLFAFNAQ